MSTGNFQALFLCPFIKCGQGQGQGCPTVGNLQICLRDGGVPQLWTKVTFMISNIFCFFNVKLCFLNFFIFLKEFKLIFFSIFLLF
jgi:hypothetical protein